MSPRRRKSARGSYNAGGSRSSSRGSWSGSGRPLAEAVAEVRADRAEATSGPSRAVTPDEPTVPSVADEDLTRRVKLVGAAFPDLKNDPKSLLALAQQPVPDDELVTSTAKTKAWVGIKSQAAALGKLPEDKQREAWDSYDGAQRKMLKSFGYKPPKKKDEGGGFFDVVSDFATDVVESIPVVGAAKAFSEGDIGTGLWRATPVGMTATPGFKGLKWAQRGAGAVDDETDDLPVLDKIGGAFALPGKASDFFVEKIGKPVLGAAEAVGDLPLHAYRTGQRLQEKAKARGEKAYGGIGEAITDPLEVSDAWSETDDPNTTFHKEKKKEARDLLDDNDSLFNLAKGLAAGKSIEDLAKKRSGDEIGSKKYQDAYLEISGLATSAKVKKAVKTLSDGRISPGMDVASDLGVDPDSGLGQAIVGATDLTIQFIFDPMLIAGKATKAYKLARWGLAADDAVGGIKAAQVTEGERLVKAFGDNWAELAAEGKITPREMVSAGAGRTAYGQEIAGAFKANTEWKAARALGDEDAARRIGNPLGELVRRQPRLLPAMDDLADYDRQLRTQKIEQRSAEAGRALTDAEARAVPGFESANDVWDFYRSTQGLTSLVAGRWARPAASFFELPRLTRTGMARVQAKLGMEKVIDFGAGPLPSVDVPLGADDVLDGNRVVKVADKLGEVPEGHTRLFRVQSGPGLDGAKAGVPDYVLRNSDQLGFEKAAGRWFTDDLERARAEAAQLGPHGRLYSVDVPNDVADAARFSNNPNVRSLAQNPSGEFLLGDDVARNAGLAGRIGSVVDAKGTPLSPALRLFQALGRRVPEGHTLPLHGSGFGQEMSRLLDMGLAGPAKDRWMQELLAADNPAVRRSLTRAALDRVFWVNGVYETPEGREIAERYLNGVKQAYAQNGKDIIAEGTEVVRAGILPRADHADGIAIPAFRDILAQSQRTSFLRTVLGNTANRPMVDAFMGSYWKPAVLLRLGFIPRAAADEMLSAILRMPDVVTNKTLWVPLAKNEGQPLWMFRPMAAVARGVQAHLPDSLLGPGTPWTERFANFVERRATGWVRGMAERKADPGMLAFSREMARNDAFKKAFADEFVGVPGGRGGVGAMRSSWLDENELGQDPVGTISIPIDPNNPQAMMKMRPVGSEMVNYSGEDFAFQGMYRFQAEHYASDPVGRATAEALSTYVHPDRAAALDGHLHATRRTLAGTPDERYATEFFDTVADSPAKAVGQIRSSLASAGPEVRGPMQRFFDLSHSDDPDTAARAGAALDAAKSAARRADDPALVMFTETAEALPQDLRWALSVDRDSVLGRLRPTPARVEPGAPLPTSDLDEPVFTARQQRWQDLAANAEAGDFQSAMDLASEVAYRELQNPENARFVRESVRSQMKRGGTPVAQPVADGFTRVYYPVFDSGSVTRVHDALTNGSQLGRRYLSQALVPDGQAHIASELAKGAGDELVPASRFATTDFDEATDLMSEIDGGLAGAAGGRSALHYVDVPDADLTAFTREAKTVGREYGSHDYWLTEGQAYRGKKIDANGPIQRDGMTALPGITTDDALRDWSNLIAEQGKDLFTSPRDGRFLHEVGTRAAQRGEYHIDWMVRQGPPTEDLPRQVLGPRRYLPSDSVWQKTTRFGFERIIGPALNSLAREPMWAHYAGARWELAKNSLLPHLIDDEAEAAALAIGRRAGIDNLDDLRVAWDSVPEALQKARSWDRAEALQQLPAKLRGMSPDDIAQLRAWVTNRDYAYGEAAQRAAEGAFRDMVPYVDDHRVRSQFSEFIRNMVPFWFAEEQFLKRWAYTLAHSPEGLRRAQLLVGAGKHFGLIRQNDHGEDVFVYPGSAQLNQLLGAVAEKVTGEPYSIPLEVPLTGQLQYATPGFDRLGVPGYSPVVSIPLTLLQRRFPELTKSASDALGRGGGLSLVDQIFPASVLRFVKAFTGSPDRDAQYGSAMIQTMQMLEANHLTPKEDAGAEEWAKYNDRVENFTRILLINRAILGFVGPASPQPEFPGDLSQEFRKMLKSLPLEEASAEFIRQHPDATPYTVFSTKSTSGATLSSSDAALKFMDDNEDLIAAYPQATAWLLPQSDDNKPANRSAFARQVQLGLRERKTPEDWQKDFFFSRAADAYFKSRDRYEIARDATDSSAKRKELDDNWRQWKESYFNQHPVFAEQLQSRDAHNRRMKTIDQMHTLLNDPRLREREGQVEHVDDLRTVMQSWDRFDSAIRSMTGDRGSSAQEKRKNLRIAFHQWGNAYVARRPKLRAFWRRVLEPEIGLDAGDLYEVG